MSSSILFVYSHRNIDILIGGASINSTTKKLFDSTITYSQDDLTWCIQRIRPIERWKNIFQFANDIELWFIGLATYFIVLFVHYFMVEHELPPLDFVTNGLVVFCAVIAMPIRFWPNSSVARLYYGFVLITALVLNTFFHSFLIVVLTHNRYGQQLSTANDLIDYDFELVGSAYALDKIKQQNLVIYNSNIKVRVNES